MLIASSTEISAMTPALAVEELRKDHEILRKDTAAFEATVRGLARSPEATGEALSGSLRARLAYFQAGMRLHFRREEEGLFPDVRRMVSEGRAGRTSSLSSSGRRRRTISAPTPCWWPAWMR